MHIMTDYNLGYYASFFICIVIHPMPCQKTLIPLPMCTLNTIHHPKKPLDRIHLHLLLRFFLCPQFKKFRPISTDHPLAIYLIMSSRSLRPLQYVPPRGHSRFPRRAEGWLQQSFVKPRAQPFRNNRVLVGKIATDLFVYDIFINFMK